MMQRQVNLLIKLIDDLLDVSRIATGKVMLQREVVDMRAVIEAALEGSQPMISCVQIHRRGAGGMGGEDVCMGRPADCARRRPVARVSVARVSVARVQFTALVAMRLATSVSVPSSQVVPLS